jgi:hypothetical protein
VGIPADSDQGFNRKVLMRRIHNFLIFAVVGLAMIGLFSANAAAAAANGHLSISFLYMPPTEIEPTYHTAIWLENSKGELVKTLFVSGELSATEYKMGNACPDWLKVAHWDKMDKADVDAATGATPNVGGGSLSFDVNELGLEPGTYQFRMEVHITEDYNILFRGPITVGSAPDKANIETVFLPNKPPSSADAARDVEVQFVPAEAK